MIWKALGSGSLVHQGLAILKFLCQIGHLALSFGGGHFTSLLIFFPLMLRLCGNFSVDPILISQSHVLDKFGFQVL
jgi:hypothetical protein